jgi:hypothetical protein
MTIDRAVSYRRGISFILIVVYFPVSRRELKYSRYELMNFIQRGPKSLCDQKIQR